MTADEQGQEEGAHPTQFGSFAAEHLSPAFPQRAPWGTAQNLRAWQAEALELSGRPGEVLDTTNGLVIACGEGALCVTELQKPGGKRLPAAEFLRGMPIAAGSRFD